MKRTRAVVAPVPADPELDALRAEWAPEWWIWRARREDGRPGSLMATRRGQGRQLSMTLMEPTAEALEQALTLQADRPVLRG